MSGAWRDVQHPKMLVGMSVVFALAASAAFYGAWRENRLSRASESSECTVLQHGVHEATDSEGSTTGYYAEVTIVHSVDGARYERVDRGSRHFSESTAREEAAKYAPGDTVACRYLPGEPEVVIVFPRAASAGWPLAMFGGMLLAMVIFFYVIERRKFAKHGPAKRGRGGDKKHQGLMVGVSIVLGLLGAGVAGYIWSQDRGQEAPENPGLDAASSGLVGVCRPAPGQPVAIIDQVRAKNRTDYRLNLVDPKTGKIDERVSLGSVPVSCLGGDGDVVWTLVTGAAGVTARSATSGEVQKTREELESALSTKIGSVAFDKTSNRLVVTSAEDEEERFYVDDDFSTEPVEDERLLDTRTSSMDVPIGRLVQRDLGQQGAKTAQGKLRSEGHPKRLLFLDDKQLGDTKWLRPQFVVDVAEGSLVWADPPSLVVCEPVKERDPHHKITRLSLEGELLWSYAPADEPSGNPHECNWYGAGTGEHLVYFTKAGGFVGIDAKTGEELYRASL